MKPYTTSNHTIYIVWFEVVYGYIVWFEVVYGYIVWFEVVYGLIYANTLSYIHTLIWSQRWTMFIQYFDLLQAI